MDSHSQKALQSVTIMGATKALRLTCTMQKVVFALHSLLNPSLYDLFSVIHMNME